MISLGYFNIEYSKANELLINLLIMTYIVLSLIISLQVFKTPIINQPVLIILGLLIVCLIWINNMVTIDFAKVSKLLILIIGVVIFLVINSVFVRHHILLGSFFSLVMGISIAKQLNLNKQSSVIMLIPFWLFVIYVLSRLLINPNPNTVFIRSRNYISFYLIITVLPYYFIKLKNFEYASIIPSIITLLLSVYSLGRTGVIASFILFIGMSLQKNISLKIKIIIILAIFLMSGVFFTYFIDYFNLYLIVEKFQDKEGLQSLGGRTVFISNYYNNLDLFSLIFGMDTADSNILQNAGGHIHSSLLNFISAVGIYSLVFFFFLFKKIKMCFKHNSGIIFLILTILLRVSTEDGVLFDYYDYSIWMFFFIRFGAKNKKAVQSMGPTSDNYFNENINKLKFESV